MLDAPRAPTLYPVPPAWSPLDLMPSGLRDDGTDMTPRIQACIDRIAASTKKVGRIRIPEGSFYLALGSGQRALVAPQNVSVRMEGVTPHAELTVDGDYCAINFGPEDGTLTHGTPTAVTADIGILDSRITVASTAALSVGTACELKSTVAFGSSSTGRNHVEGEVVRVKTIVSATQFDVEGRLMFDYAVADSPTVTPLVLTEGCGIANLSFRNLDYNGTGANNMAARFTGCYEPHAENIHMRKFDGAGLSFADCLDFISQGVHSRDFNNNTTLGYNGYTHRLYGACSGGIILGGTARKGRHFVTTVGPDAGIAPRHIKVIGCHATELSAAGFDNHAGARFMTFEDCSVEDGNFGFVVRSADTTIINPIVRNCGGGISVQGAFTSRQNFGHRCKVRGGVLENLNGNYHAVEVAGVDDFDMDGTFIKDVIGPYPGSGSHHNGIFIGKDESASSGGDNTSFNARVTNVRLVNILPTEKAAIYVDSGTGHYFDNIDVDGAYYAIDGESDTSYGVGRLRTANITTSLFGPFSATVTSPGEISGTGAPTVRAPQGTIYRRTDGDPAAGTAKYIQSASGWATTWLARVASVAGRTGAVTLAKGDVGLGNVDNTADTAKPVSTAQQTALDLKINTSAKAAASGVASLDSSGYVPAAQLGNQAVPSVNGRTGAVVLTKADAPSRVVALTDAATIAVNADTTDVGTVTLAGNRTLGAPTGTPTDGQELILRFRQDATGLRTLAFNAAYRFSSDLPTPSLSTVAAKTDYARFRYHAADAKWDCVSFLKGF